MNLSDMNVLVVEDHAFQRRSLVRMLTDLGAKSVAEATDGKAALTMLLRNGIEIDLIICDLDMPEMDGMEFIRHVGQCKSSASVILSSALDASVVASAENMTRAYGVSIIGALAKPPTPGRLTELIGKHTLSSDGNPAVRSNIEYTAEEIGFALESGQFLPHFQPKVELATGRVIGAEALARWRHPRDGLVSPAAFMPLLDSSGMAEKLTWRMLEESARACKNWRNAGHDLNVSVNLSQSMLSAPHIANRVTEIVRAQGLAAGAVILEITESAAMRDLGAGLENLTRLRMKGFGLSIDDFGTGYSSMQQLSRIPFTELKLDRSFVADADTHLRLRFMIETSLSLAGKLGMEFIAEGVETRDEWDTLKQLGCYAAQGYYICRPMDGMHFAEWLRTWTAPD